MHVHMFQLRENSLIIYWNQPTLNILLWNEGLKNRLKKSKKMKK